MIINKCIEAPKFNTELICNKYMKKTKWTLQKTSSFSRKTIQNKIIIEGELGEGWSGGE